MSATRQHRKAAKKQIKRRAKKAEDSSISFQEAIEALGNPACASWKQINDFNYKV